MLRKLCPVPVPVTTTTMATTTVPAPSQCLTAQNLTQRWRISDRGGNRDGTMQCDSRTMISQGRPWFRFSGAAGSSLSNICVPPYSCMSCIGFWSNDVMPSSVGQVTRINFYGSWTSGCKTYTQPANVIRCSSRSKDFIYQYLGSTVCNGALCSM